MSSQKDIALITCPVCGSQFLPSEIYLPNSFFGKQQEIHRKVDGRLDYYLGDDPDLNEEFICESCLTRLRIKANLSFDVRAISEENFDEDYVTEIDKPAKIKLSEETLFND